MRSIALLLVLAASTLAQSDVSISVVGDVPQPLTLKTADFQQLPRAMVSTTNNGVVTTFEGVWLSEVLKKAGFGPGTDKTGYVLATASDGYQVLFSLGELDPTITENQYLIADKANGRALSGRDGTYRLVVPKDIRGLRSVRQLAKLEVVLLIK